MFFPFCSSSSDGHVGPSGGVARCKTLLSHGPDFMLGGDATACDA